MKRKIHQGLSVIEVLIGAAIILFTVSATALAFQAIIRSASLANHITEAAFLLEEGVESIKVLRGAGWTAITNITPGTAYTPVFSAGTWALQTNHQYVNGLFDRTITISNVYRDGSQNIADAGTLDSDAKKVTVSVAWRERQATTTKTISTYVTNF